MTEKDMIETVNYTIVELTKDSELYQKNNDITMESKACALAEITVALLLLKQVKRSDDTTSNVTKLTNYFTNQQLIYLAKKSISKNEELTVAYNDLKDVNYYTI
jgi:hypothetical protein